MSKLIIQIKARSSATADGIDLALDAELCNGEIQSLLHLGGGPTILEALAQVRKAVEARMAAQLPASLRVH